MRFVSVGWHPLARAFRIKVDGVADFAIAAAIGVDHEEQVRDAWTLVERIANGGSMSIRCLVPMPSGTWTDVPRPERPALTAWMAA